MGKKEKFKGKSKLKGRDAATGINVRKERERIAHFEKTGQLITATVEKCAITFEPTEGESDPIISIDPGNGRLSVTSSKTMGQGYVDEAGRMDVTILDLNLESGEPITLSEPEDRHRELYDKTREFFKANPVKLPNLTTRYDPDKIHFDRAIPTIAPNLPNADYDMDILNPMPVRVPAIRGISTFLTPAEIEGLHKGEFVASGDFTRGLELGKQDPFFFAVVGAPAGTIIANSKGSVLLPNVKIPLGSKFDYRF